MLTPLSTQKSWYLKQLTEILIASPQCNQKYTTPHSITQISTIFKTITDESTLSGQRIVGALQARKIAQQQATAQLETDIACLK